MSSIKAEILREIEEIKDMLEELNKLYKGIQKAINGETDEIVSQKDPLYAAWAKDVAKCEDKLKEAKDASILLKKNIEDLRSKRKKLKELHQQSTTPPSTQTTTTTPTITTTCSNTLKNRPR
jgi:uncharacterized protein (DUF3084 family)